jgi:hypothetical protein
MLRDLAALDELGLAQPLRLLDPRDHPVAHERHAIRHGEKLVVVRADQDHALARARELINEPVDGNLGANIDTLRRLVENENLGVGMQPARDDHLLLVAPREEVDRFALGLGRDLQLSNIVMAKSKLGGEVQPATADDRGEIGDRDIAWRIEVGEQAVCLAVLGQQGEPGPDYVLRPVGTKFPTCKTNLARRKLVKTKQRSRDRGPARAQNATETENLAAMHYKGGLAHAVRRGEPLDLKQQLGGGVALFRVVLRDLAPHHRGYDRADLDPGRFGRAHDATVAQHRGDVD